MLNNECSIYKSIEESYNLATNMSVPGFFVGHDTLVSGDHHVSKLPTWQDAVGPFFKIRQSKIVSWGDYSTFVDSTNELNDNFLGAMIINDFKLSNISMLLHKPKELNDHFRDGSNENLLFAFSFSIDNSFEAVSQDVHFDHCLE